MKHVAALINETSPETRAAGRLAVSKIAKWSKGHEKALRSAGFGEAEFSLIATLRSENNNNNNNSYEEESDTKEQPPTRGGSVYKDTSHLRMPSDGRRIPMGPIRSVLDTDKVTQKKKKKKK
eukprot:Trichotokara_eunicae@DN4034_c0_g1_i1.p1